MSRLIATFRKDMTMSFRSFYIYIELIMALIIIGVLLFVVPENFQTESHVYVYANIEAEGQSQLIEMLNGQTAEGMIIEWTESEQALYAALEANRSSSGVLISFESEKPVFEFVLQGYESESVKNILEKAFLAETLQMMPGYQSSISLTVLDETAEKLPDRINLLPILLVLNSALIGLFIITAYIYIDKEEGTITAYSVTPAATWQYLLSKMGMMLFTGTLTGLMTVLAVAGSRVHIFHFLIFMAACNIFGSALGLLISSFFNSMTKSLGALYVVVIIMGLASVSYMMPAFSPLLIRLLPAYPMLYAFRQTLLASPDLGYIYFWAAVFMAAGVVLFVFANLRFRKTLTV